MCSRTVAFAFCPALRAVQSHIPWTITSTCRKTPPLEIFSWLANRLAICEFPVDSWVPRPLVEFLGPQSKLVGQKTVTHGRPCLEVLRNFGVIHGCGRARDTTCKVGRRSSTGGRLQIVLGNCARKSRRRAVFLRCLRYCMQGLPPPSEPEGAWNLHRKIWTGGWHAKCNTLLAANDGWKAPTQFRMGGWHARSDTCAGST